jgi:hypothetical protein
MSINFAVWFNRFALVWMLAATPIVVARAGKFDCGSDLMPGTADDEIQVPAGELAAEESIHEFDITLITQAWPRRSEVVEHPAIPVQPVVVASIDPRVGGSPLLFTIGDEYQSYDLAQNDIAVIPTEGELWNTIGLPQRPFGIQSWSNQPDSNANEDADFDAQSLAMIDVVEAELAAVLAEISQRRVVDDSFIAAEQIVTYFKSIDFNSLPMLGRYIAAARSVAEPDAPAASEPQPAEQAEEEKIVDAAARSLLARAEAVEATEAGFAIDQILAVGRKFAASLGVKVNVDQATGTAAPMIAERDSAEERSGNSHR